MTARQTRLAKALVVAGIVFLAAGAIRAFPWKGTYRALLGAHFGVLFAALSVNLLSMLAKGTAWHLLLRPLAPHRWSSALIATFVGTSANCFSVSVAGEAVRIHSIVKRGGVPRGAAVVSVVWARIVEIISLALFLAIVPTLIPLPHVWRWLQVAACASFAAFAVLTSARKKWRLPAWAPGSIRRALDSVVRIGSWQRVIGPVALGFANWIIQWSTFHLALQSLGVRPTLAASLTALLVTNLGGLLRLTPANLGVFQATMVGSLISFGIPSERAMAASLALQAIQVIPVVLIGFLLFIPWRRMSAGKAADLDALKKDPLIHAAVAETRNPRL